MKRINVVETFGQLKPAIGHVVVNLRNGERLEGKADTVPGKPESPLTKAEITDKFHDCSSDLADEARRNQIADMVWNLESLGSLTDLGDAVRLSPDSSRVRGVVLMSPVRRPRHPRW